jgi:SAM-dependent methyltransferase
MNDIACPICQKADRVKVLLSKSEEQGGIGAWSCGCCCHAWRTEPWKLSNAAEFFGKAHYTKIEFAEKVDATKMELFQFLADYADKTKPQQPRLMVDFGCSYGTVLQMFRQRNWQVMGIEISPSAQKVLDERKLPWAPTMEQSGLARRSVDVVVMSDSIYYLHEPVETLRTIQSYMRPAGLLFLRQPTRGSLVHLLSHLSREKALADRLWLDHVHLFSRQSTGLALNRTGFSDVKFLVERHFKRSLKGEIIHRLLRAVDFATLRRLDLVASWTVIAKALREACNGGDK